MKIRIIISFLSLLIFSADYVFSQTTDSTENKYLYVDLLNLPVLKKIKYRSVKIAVVDVGYRLSHKAIKDFIFENDNEIPNNYRDDDKNGYIDDVYGWDFADNDNNVSIPEHRKSELFHGTFIIGVITRIFSQYCGEQAKDFLKIIPIKVYSDNSKRGELTHGYEGIKYAADMGADIIYCPWSGGKLRLEDKMHLDYALSKGCIIIAAAGNLNTEQDFPPGNYPNVYSIASVNYNCIKTKKSNFTKLNYLSAYGENIYAPHSDADNAYIFDGGTSAAGAIIAGCTGILKTIASKSGPDEIMSVLINTANPIDGKNRTYAGKLGAGVPDMTRAIEYLTNNKFRYRYFNRLLPKGTISFQKGKTPEEYMINPNGDFKCVQLITNNYSKKGNVQIFDLKDSLIFQGSIEKIKKGIMIDGNGLLLKVDKKNPPTNFNFSYYMETIDSTTLFCSGETYLTDENGTISDGSGDNNYSNGCFCKWIITAPIGKKIKITFNSIDTETDKDYIWIFDGTSSLPENILAKFSGQILPPSITSFSNEVVIWFLTNENITGKGWKLNYEIIQQ